MEINEFVEVLLTDQQKVWKEMNYPNVLRAVASGVHDEDGHPIEHWCLITAACHAHTQHAFHPADYREAAKKLYISQSAALSISMFGDGMLRHSHPLYAPLRKLTSQLLNRGVAMPE